MTDKNFEVRYCTNLEWETDAFGEGDYTCKKGCRVSDICFEHSCPYDTRSSPAPQPDAPKFNSTDLILLAHDEWKRREERKHNHPENHWCSGFINGFLTDKKWARELLDKMQKDADNKLRQHGGDR